MHVNALLPLAVLLTACAGAKLDPEANSSHAASSVFEYKASPRIAIAGEPIRAASMSAYANELGVHAAGMAVFKDGALVHQEFAGDGIGPDSVFQGASFAKAIASATIATLAMREGIGLDEDVAPYITSFDLTQIEGYQAPVTLRQLLSHTSRAGVEGFQGYPQSAELPTNVELILGSDRSNSQPVSFSQPEGRWSYSGGGYQIAQAFAEDVSGLPFGQLAQALVLDPVGMTRSAMTQSYDPDARPKLKPVTGVETSGPVEGGWHNYPEIATAGLWTTAEDYGKFVLAIMAAADGVTDTGIHPDVAAEMLTVAGHPNKIRGYGLGLGILIGEDGQIESFEHHGRNVGYNVSFSAFPKDRAASVVVTNHPNGLFLATESNRGFGERLGYTDPVARTISRQPLSDALRAHCLGAYAEADSPDETVSLSEEDGEFVFKNATAAYPIIHLGDGAFLHLATDTPFQCAPSEQGVTLSLGRSTVYVKQP